MLLTPLNLLSEKYFVICHCIKKDNSDIKFISKEYTTTSHPITTCLYRDYLVEDYKKAIMFNSYNEANSFINNLDDSRLSFWKSNLFVCELKNESNLLNCQISNIGN